MSARPIRPSSMSRDVIATYGTQAWTAIMGIAFVPVYIRYLGIEAYGIIGLFATLQSMLVILDLGMTPTLTREIARFSGGERDSAELRDLLRSVEISASLIGLTAAVGIWAASDWLAHSWLQSQSIPPAEVAQALAIMGAVSALRFVEGIFRGAILGLHRQVLYNGIVVVTSTLRGIGAIIILAKISPTLEAFFVWQGLISITTVAALAWATYGALPFSERPGRFSWLALKSVWRFAAGMLGISLLALLLTQTDKILLSRLLSLSDFAGYMLATVVAGALELVISPLFQAITPRMSRLHAAGDGAGFVNLYHLGAQIVTVTGGVAGLMLFAFPDWVILAWTADTALAARVAPILRWLALGYVFNLLMWMPYQAQLAYRWTGLALRINLVAVIVLVPVLLWTVPRFGPTSAAMIWAALNASYVLIGLHLMHRRILHAEKWRWYIQDVTIPLAYAGAWIGTIRWLVTTPPSSRIGLAVLLAGIAALAFAMACAAASLLRPEVLAFWRKRMLSLQ
ncbi:lipopolysaccharide biosynthesis protein [Sphingomonas albertensis]|nr:oligosaccharide flippase family protein [Sphingomonas albertensis]